MSSSIFEAEEVVPARWISRRASLASITLQFFRSDFLFLTLLACLAVAVNGYHPFSEDGGIYAASVKHAIDPRLYGSSADFIAPYSSISCFSNLVAWFARCFRFPLEYLLFSLNLLTIWLMLFACRQLARRCFALLEAQWASVALAAACLSVPVAGSALFLMDPYFTSRSFSTPLSLLAICACLDLKMTRVLLLLILTALFHSLMAIYATAFVVVLWLARRKSRQMFWIESMYLSTAVIVTGATIQYTQHSKVETSAYRAAVATRTYFFLSQWHWYELFGLIAPLALLTCYCLWRRKPDEPEYALARASIATGSTSIVFSTFFARPGSQTHFLAAMQPMRMFLPIYLCMFLLLGGLLGELWLKRIVWRWLFLFLSLGICLAAMQHRTYPSSSHIEWPGTVSQNDWNKAFLWIRANTAINSVIALDANYISAPHEDAQGFRAISERSSLADFSKDGGTAAIFPALAERWMNEHKAQTSLNLLGDAELRRHLEPFHVSWIVLDRNTATAMPCPFEDDTVKVCRLR